MAHEKIDDYVARLRYDTENDEEYGDLRLCELIESNADKSVNELKEIIIDSILSFLNGRNLSDDLTLILLKT